MGVLPMATKYGQRAAAALRRAESDGVAVACTVGSPTSNHTAIRANASGLFRNCRAYATSLPGRDWALATTVCAWLTRAATALDWNPPGFLSSAS